jgi:hypothetical protein
MRKMERKGGRAQSRAEHRAAVERYERKRPQPQETEQGLEPSQRATGCPSETGKRP